MSWFKKNIANIISLTRVVLIPFIILSLLSHHTTLFLMYFTIAFMSDAIDGTIARLLKSESDFGRFIDSISDYIFYPLVIITTFYVLREDVSKHLLLLILPTLFFLIPKLIGIYYLKTYPHIHLKAWQITAYPLVVWIIISVVYGFNTNLLYVINFTTFIGFIEESVIFLIKKDKTNQSVHSLSEALRK